MSRFCGPKSGPPLPQSHKNSSLRSPLSLYSRFPHARKWKNLTLKLRHSLSGLLRFILVGRSPLFLTQWQPTLKSFKKERRRREGDINLGYSLSMEDSEARGKKSLFFELISFYTVATRLVSERKGFRGPRLLVSFANWKPGTA